ncbi:hypothetical protein [Proteus hauseri]|uniref:hypothetical protein n=1 Tax=Proteus hauseri TaxID=183417 RepID=UPI0032DB52C3
MAYEFLTQTTCRKLATGEEWLKQRNDSAIIDVSLNAGQLAVNERAADKDFITIVQQLDVYCRQLEGLFPFIEFTKNTEFHSTLLAIFNQKQQDFAGHKVMLYQWCREIAHLFTQHNTIELIFSNVVLTSNGSVVLTAISSELESFRQMVYKKIPIDGCLHKNIIHLTLGRLSKNTSSENIKNFYDYISNNNLNTIFSSEIPSWKIEQPKFVISQGSLSSEIISNITHDFNQLWFDAY